MRRFVGAWLVGALVVVAAASDCVGDDPNPTSSSITPDATSPAIDGAPADAGLGDATKDVVVVDGTKPIVLATGQACPTAFAVAGPYVYWINRGFGTPPIALSGAVMRAPKDPVVIDGGLQSPTTLAASQQDPAGIFVDPNGGFFWTTTGSDGGVWSCPNNGCANGVRTLAANVPGFPSSPVADATHVYWSISTPVYSVFRAARDGGVERFSGSVYPSQPLTVAIDGDWVYWTAFSPASDGGAIYRATKNLGMDASLLAPVDMPGAIVFEDAGMLFSTMIADGGIYRMPREGVPDGSAPEAVASARGLPRGPAIDATHIYWFGDNGATLLRMPKAGGPMETLASNQHNVSVQGPLVTNDAIYWTNCGTPPDDADGTVVKLMK